MAVPGHRHDVRPPNAASDFHEAKARSASRWLRLASSASEATKHRTDVGKDSASKAFPLMDLRAMFMCVAPVRRREALVAGPSCRRCKGTKKVAWRGAWNASRPTT